MIFDLRCVNGHGSRAARRARVQRQQETHLVRCPICDVRGSSSSVRPRPCEEKAATMDQPVVKDAPGSDRGLPADLVAKLRDIAQHQRRRRGYGRGAEDPLRGNSRALNPRQGVARGSAGALRRHRVLAACRRFYPRLTENRVELICQVCRRHPRRVRPSGLTYFRVTGVPYIGYNAPLFGGPLAPVGRAADMESVGHWFRIQNGLPFAGEYRRVMGSIRKQCGHGSLLSW